MRAWRGVSSGFAAESGAAPGLRQQRDGRGLPDMDPQQVEELELFGGEVMTLPVQRHRDLPAAGGGHRDGHLVVDFAPAVEVAVKAEGAELAVAEEVGDPPGPAVPGGPEVGQDRVLGQMLLEQLDAAGEGADVGGLDEPGQQAAPPPPTWL